MRSRENVKIFSKIFAQKVDFSKILEIFAQKGDFLKIFAEPGGGSPTFWPNLGGGLPKSEIITPLDIYAYGPPLWRKFVKTLP